MTDVSALSGLRILIVGLGREGVALATYLTGHGLTVKATDLQSADQLGAALSALEAAGVTLTLGEHPLSLLEETDILFVSPGVPLEVPFLQEAQSRNIPLSTESRLFCHLCPAPILGVTGSSGKTTTTTLLGEMLKADHRQVWVGGNIGQPLIGVVDQIEADHLVVMELSSFQLEYFHARLNRAAEVPAKSEALRALLDNWSPSISAILNITPNHLDRHPSMKHYVQAKRAIIDYQRAGGRLIMNLDNDMTRTIGAQFGPRTRWFSLEAQIPGGACLIDNKIALLDQDSQPSYLASRQEIKIRGMHNLSNILAACLMAREVGVSLAAMQEVITTFSGVEHRLELVRELHGVRYYNDSISTSPERLAAALRSFDEPIILLAGGRDKHLPWEEAARLIVHKTKDVILFGQASDLIAEAIERAEAEVVTAKVIVHHCDNLEAAVDLATELGWPGDLVLLSPGCTSFDAFRDFAERGRYFKSLVQQL